MSNCCVGPGPPDMNKKKWISLIMFIFLSLIQESRSLLINLNETSAYACEGSTLYLSCSKGQVLRITRANYGRFSLRICNQWGKSSGWDLQCGAKESRIVVSERCDGRNKCNITANNRVFSDSCPQTYKYLVVYYYCERTAFPEPTPPPLPSTTSQSSTVPLTTVDSSTVKGGSTSDGTDAPPPITTNPHITKKPPPTPRPFCVGRTEEGVYWTNEMAGVVAHKSCPGRLKGVMSWECGMDGKWIGKPDVTDCFSDVMTPKPLPGTRKPSPDDPVIKYCPSVEREGVFWPTVIAGEITQRLCQNGKLGMMSWRCGMKGRWLGKPDLSQCVSQWGHRLGDQLKEEDVNVEEVAALLVKSTTSEAIGPGDLFHTAKNLMPKLGQIAKKQFRSSHIDTKAKQKKVKSFSKALVTAGSNLLSTKTDESWQDLNVTARKKVASALVRSMEDTGFEIAEIMQHEQSVVAADENLLMEVSAVNTTYRTSGNFVFPSQDAGRSWLQGSDHFIISQENLKQNSEKGLAKVVFLVYQNLDKWMNPKSAEEALEEEDYIETTEPAINQAKDDEDSFAYNIANKEEKFPDVFVNSHVFCASLGGRTEPLPLQKPVQFLMRHINKIDNSYAPVCSFWKFDESGETGNWSSEGCRVVHFNTSHTMCECDHLTNFAVLMDYVGTVLPEAHVVSLQVITYVGCIISIICLIMSFFTFCFFKNLQCDRNTIHKNLVLTLMLAEILFLCGIGQTSHRVVCAVIAGFLHYLFLTAFGWMCLEGFQLYVMLIEVFDSGKSRAKYYYAAGYGIPALIVAMSVGILPSGYGTDRHCWLQTDNGFIWSFVGPVACVLFVNVIMLIIAVYMMSRHANTLASALRTKEKSRLEKISRDPSSSESGNSMLKDQEKTRIKTEMPAWLKGAIVLVVLLGLTWAFGILYISEESVVMAYVFTVLNSLQGLFIFLFHCLFNEKVKKEYKKLAYRSTWLPTCLRNLCIGSTSSSHSHSSSSSGGHLLKFWSGRRNRKSSSSTVSTPARGNKRRSDPRSDFDSYSSQSQTKYTNNGFGHHGSGKSNGHTPLYPRPSNGIVGDLSYADCSVIDSEFVSEYCAQKLRVSEDQKRFSSGSELSNHFVSEDPVDKHSLSALSTDSNLKHASEFASSDDIDKADQNYYTEPVQSNHYSEIKDPYVAGNYHITSSDEINQNIINSLLSGHHYPSAEVHVCDENRDVLKKDYKLPNNNSIGRDPDGAQDPLLLTHRDTDGVDSTVPNTTNRAHNPPFQWK